MQKERLTVEFCANATGTHKIPRLVIGKSRKPRCFRNAAELNQMPVVWNFSKEAWMNQLIFEDWITFTFLPEVNRRQREEGRVGNILLLLDNFSAHKCLSERATSNDRLILSLPENTTSLIQPMDQGVIVKVKRLYRRALASCLLDSYGTQDEFYKEHQKEGSLSHAARRIDASNTRQHQKLLQTNYARGAGDFNSRRCAELVETEKKTLNAGRNIIYCAVVATPHERRAKVFN